MNNLKILLKNHFLEFKRTKKWLVYILVFTFIGIVSALTSKYLLPALSEIFEMMGLIYTTSIADSYIEFAANMGEISYLLIVIMFSTSLFKEKSSSTYYLLKSNGVKESEIVVSHYISKLILITLSYLASLLVYVPLNIFLFKSYTGYRGVVSLSYIYLLLVFALSFAVFISSFITKKSHGIVIGVVSYFVLTILSSIPNLDIFTPYYALTLSSNIMREQTHILKDYLINGFTTLLLSIGFVFLSIYLFKNKIDNRNKGSKNNG